MNYIYISNIALVPNVQSFSNSPKLRNYELNNFSLRQLMIDNHHSNYKSPRSHSVNGENVELHGCIA